MSVRQLNVFDTRAEADVVFDDSALRCPCGGGSLHLVGIDVWYRAREDGDSVRFSVMGGANTKTNPSKRRDAIAIRFYCETCPVWPVLAVYQHKGSTYFEWLNAETVIEESNREDE